MSRKQRIKTGIDLLMFLALMMLMPYGMVGETAHEWIGMAMFLLFLAHHFMNLKWTRNIRKGKYSRMRLVQTALVFLLLLCMIGSMTSGILISRVIFQTKTTLEVASFAEKVHMVCAYWGFLLMAVHLGFHWSMFLKMMEKKTGPWKQRIVWFLRFLAFAAAAYGVYAFWKLGIGMYLFLRSHFVFFDYSEPLLFFLADYMAILILFVLFGYYAAEFLRKRM